jgi:hypothetical protein
MAPSQFSTTAARSEVGAAPRREVQYDADRHRGPVRLCHHRSAQRHAACTQQGGAAPDEVCHAVFFDREA